ncbi:MAG: magnesium transporter [SAR202 cluster bacterium]|jgi:magnesium transporter|nr:magnesium transporter [SAR202 cluster bacterium]
MENQPTLEEATFSVQEPPDLERAAMLIQELLESDKALEAVVRFSRFRPPDQADVMAQLSRDTQAELLSRLTASGLGTIMEELEPEEAVDLSQDMEPERLSQVLDETSPDVAADVLRGLPEDLASTTLQGMEEARDVTPLLGYEDDDAGGLMTPEFIALRESMTVARALDFVREHEEELDPEDISHLFILGRDGVLKGDINLAQLVLARPYQRVALLMRSDPISVPVETDQEQCARLMQRYNLTNLPVVDDDARLVGVLKLENMVDVIEDEATEDLYRMVGVDEEEKPLGPYWESVRSRLPWLSVNLGTLVVAGLVITMFESTLSRAVALAAFLPVIAGQGGIAGTQTLTLIVRSLALDEITTVSVRRLLLREIGLGLVHGLALATLVGVIALAWKGSEYLALVVAAALVANMVVGGVTGVLVPLGLKAMRIDPALASAVAVTTATDIIGFLVFLGLALATIGLITGSL